MRCLILILPAVTALIGFSPQAKASIVLGSAGNFAVLGGSTVTNAGPSLIDGGDMGVSPGGSITGFPPGVLVAPYAFHLADPVAVQAQADLATAYNQAVGLAFTQDLTGQGLGGLTLQPGVYHFNTSAQLTGTLTLDAQGNPNAEFVFQIGSTLTTASNAAVVMINSGSLTPGSTVFWQIGSSATLGTNTAFEGHILAFSSITVTAGTSIVNGSALAMGGAVTLDTNIVTNSISAVPEPGAVTLTLISGALLGLPALKKKWLGLRKRGRGSEPLK